MIDHETFKAREVEALVGELDADASAAMSEHAAACATCNARLEGLRTTRSRAFEAMMEPVPENFEARIMAAVDAALARRAATPLHVVGGAPMMTGAAGAPGGVSSGGGAAGGGAKIIALFSRPSFAVAATFVLVLGAAAFMLQAGARKAPSASATSMADEAPAAVAQGAAPGEPMATLAAPPPVAPTPLASMMAFNENAPSVDSRGPAAEGKAFAPTPPSVMAAPAVGGMTRSVAPKPAAKAPADPAFANARRLYDAGRYAEALPKFEALKATIPEADLYAARCIQKTRGCAAAAPRYDSAADSNAGTESGSRARLEAGQCYQSMGQAQAARSRYETAQAESILAEEAARDLESLDKAPASPAATATAGRPAAGRPAAPRATPKALDPASK